MFELPSHKITQKIYKCLSSLWSGLFKVFSSQYFHRIGEQRKATIFSSVMTLSRARWQANSVTFAFCPHVAWRKYTRHRTQSFYVFLSSFSNPVDPARENCQSCDTRFHAAFYPERWCTVVPGWRRRGPANVVVGYERFAGSPPVLLRRTVQNSVQREFYTDPHQLL